jgi:NAD(P)-dependent dehydrogenase (short-subunit alcohol dehydrogenase family)
MSYEIDLSGKVALVTGASSGLGAQFARVLVRSGASVALAARRLDRLEALRSELQGRGGRAVAVSLDVTDLASIEQAVGRAEKELGPVDVLINNSGVSTTQKLTDTRPEDFDHVFGTNVRGAFFVAQAVARRMIERARTAAPGGPPSARIVNIASMAGLRVISQLGVYCMSKSAVVQMTRAMALEWGRFGINVNAICPGYIDTEINHAYWATEGGRKLIEMTPRKRIGAPQDLDALLVMLCSEQSSFVNGSIIAADDGFAV